MFVGWKTARAAPHPRGRFLNLVFILDDLEGFSTTGLLEPRALPDSFDSDLQDQVAAAFDFAKKLPDYRSGITLIVGCGLGRAGAAGLSGKTPPGWRIEFVSAADLVTLSGLDGFKPLSLWRVLDAEARVAKEGVSLQNVNGLLNMVAWNRMLDGHLVPHGQLPDGFVDGGGPSLVIVDQNGLRDLTLQLR